MKIGIIYIVENIYIIVIGKISFRILSKHKRKRRKKPVIKLQLLISF